MPTEITVTTYQFDELTEAAKDNARNWFKEMIDSTPEISEFFTYVLKTLNFPTDCIEYSLSCCQGDGMAFYGAFDPIAVLTKSLTCENEFPDLALTQDQKDDVQKLLTKINEIGAEYFAGKIVRNSYGFHYSHYNTMEIKIECYKDFSPDHEKQIQEISLEAEKIIETYVKTISKHLEKQGYDIIEDALSDESVDENIRINEYAFTKNGKRYHVL